MRRGLTSLLLASITLPAPAALAAGFDGEWQTAITCDSQRGARFYVQQFTSTVKDGVLLGVHGTAGEPGSLQLSGRIAPDGSARLHASGRTGPASSSISAGLAPGTPYAYDVDAHFTGSSGTGERTAGRSCKLRFER